MEPYSSRQIGVCHHSEYPAGYSEAMIAMQKPRNKAISRISPAWHQEVEFEERLVPEAAYKTEVKHMDIDRISIGQP